MKYNFNKLEKSARNLMGTGNFSDALSIYYFMSDGDSSLDAGYLGHRIGLCYERRGELQAAKYWYGRAVEENPTIEQYIRANNRLSNIKIDHLIKLYYV